MKLQALLRTLQATGLGEKEATIYLAALQAGPTTVSELARRSGIKRTTLYHVLDQMFAEGLLKKEIHGIKERIVAENPDTLEILLEQKRRDLDRVLPYLRSLQAHGESESIIRHVEGLEKIAAVYDEMIQSVKPGDDYLVLSNMERWHRLMPAFFDAFLERRSRLPIQVKMILGDGKLARKRKTEARKPNERTRILSRTSDLTTNLIIIPTKVFFHQFEAPYTGVVIANPHIVQMHREMYEIMWASLGD